MQGRPDAKSSRPPSMAGEGEGFEEKRDVLGRFPAFFPATRRLFSPRRYVDDAAGAAGGSTLNRQKAARTKLSVAGLAGRAQRMGCCGSPRWYVLARVLARGLIALVDATGGYRESIAVGRGTFACCTPV
ncbi:hypothetical protein ColLi_04923 [Colletotrichum liriopes]|uniref:Uncharacterized protein n=1 Tax=Colletotrichum liriopes TaxID=708192 RepID=A0AA37GJI1_9PEZI|nr:hypothetical protein ColLi_04923 [Colletotrichum liriopes]